MIAIYRGTGGGGTDRAHPLKNGLGGFGRDADDEQQIPHFVRNDKNSRLLHSTAGNLQEVGGADDTEGNSDYEGEAVAGGIMDDLGRG